MGQPSGSITCDVSDSKGDVKWERSLSKGVDSYPGGKDRYVDDVSSLLKDLAGNPVSFVILGAISRTPGKLTIVPESERPRQV